jgi:outer membrane receptor protein involved in Fe transport
MPRSVAIALAVALALFATHAARSADTPTDKPAEKAKSAEDVAKLSDISVSEDPLRHLSNEPSASSFGFSKPLLETPRTVSFVSEEQISVLGISSADDLTRVVPGVVTNRRWGYQGGIDIRGVTADTYFRGMKRVQLQGHARTSLAGMDSIEVVKGPPSPIYGMGRIGGYTNLTPKTGRAKTGTYLPGAQGFAQLLEGSWERSEVTFGLGGPLSLAGKNGGYYLYGLIEDTPQTWIERVPVKQKIIQAANSIDHFIGPFRLEVGGMYQNSITAGAYMNRVTQQLIDHGTYITGSPLVHLDTNGDGQIGLAETFLNSPVKGLVTTTPQNQPLNQDFAWPTDPATGQLAVWNGQQLPQKPGIPKTMLDYLGAHPEINCRAAQVMRGMPAGGPGPASGQLPVGFVLNPCTVGTTQVNDRRGAYEKEQNAKLTTLFLDMVYDTDPDFTVKNQLFYDRLQSYKNSQLPYGETQSIWTAEDKLTATRRIPDAALPRWLRVNALGSINHRITSAYAASGGGDYDFRNDIMANGGFLSVDASFWNNRENASYATGAPVTAAQRSRYTESGIGLMFDMDIFRKTNLIVGGRFDWAKANGADLPRFAQGCTKASPCFSTSPVVGMYLPYGASQRSDRGPSWSISLSHEFPFGIRPYFTYGVASVVLDGPNNILSRSTIDAPSGFIGSATIKEAGIKASLFGGKLLWTSAAFNQTRTDISNPLDPTASADVTSTQTKGVEAEIKWQPLRSLYVALFGVHQTVDYIFATTSNIEFTGRQLGFTDVIDPLTGAVLYPAEAFTYGGRTQVPLPANMRGQYLTRNGNPQDQLGLNSSYQAGKHLAFNLGANWFSRIPVTRVTALMLPSAFVLNTGATWDYNNWHVQLNVNNALDERYFLARNGDTVSQLVSVLPGRNWTATIKHEFR